MKSHFKTKGKSLIVKAIRKYGKDSFMCEILENFDNLPELIIAEIKYIKKFKSFGRGYNQTPGGEFLKSIKLLMNENDKKFYDNFLSQKQKDLWNKLSDKEKIYRVSGLKKWNKDRWSGLSIEEKRKEIQHLFTQEINEKKSKSMIIYWDNQLKRKEQSNKLKLYFNDLDSTTRNKRSKISRNNGIIGGLKTSKKFVIFNTETNISITYNSKLEAHKQTGLTIRYLEKKTKSGQTLKGFKGWEL